MCCEAPLRLCVEFTQKNLHKIVIKDVMKKSKVLHPVPG